ncbi:MAG: FmdB family zinc ribbon protein [Gemmatimonadaceae bacterium]
MPTYEYRCPQGHEFEHFFSTIGGSKEIMPCTTCGRDAQRLVSGGAGLLFKGSGFYITDYGKDGKKSERERAAKKETKSEGGSSGETKSTSETKPAGESKPVKKTDSGE